MKLTTWPASTLHLPSNEEKRRLSESIHLIMNSNSDSQVFESHKVVPAQVHRSLSSQTAKPYHACQHKQA